MKPDDVPQWAWDQAKTKDGFDYKQDVKIVVARAIVQARSQAFEESAKIAEKHAGVDRSDNTRFVAHNISQAIRQHSQKGKSE